jgi:hypothetical protein
MPGKCVISTLVLAALTVVAVAQAAHAATPTTSFAVTAYVEAQCRVSPNPSAFQIRSSELTVSGQVHSEAAASVNCSLPVAYQIVVESSPQMRLSALGSPGNDSASEHLQPVKPDHPLMLEAPSQGLHTPQTSDSAILVTIIY